MSNTLVQPYVVDNTGSYTFANVTVTTQSNLGQVGNVKITGGTAGQVISTDGGGNLSFINPSIAPRAVAMTMGIIFGG